MRSYSRSFAGGEVSPELFGRIDDVRFQTGLARARNFITLPHGPARNRPGFVFVAELDPAVTARFLPFQFSTTQTTGIVLAADGSDGFIRFVSGGAMRMVTDGGTPATYKGSITFTPAGVNTGSETITFGASHGFSTGDPLRFTIDSGTVLPAPLTAMNPIYYAIATGATTLKVALTAADAIAGTAIDLTSTGTGATFRVNYAYTAGDLVGFLGAYFYCLQNPTINGAAQEGPGSTSYWYQQPATGEYEIPSPFADDELWDVRYAQSNDVVTLVHPSYAPRELWRVQDTRWRIAELTFAPTLEAPTGVSVSPTQPGIAADVTSVVGLTPLRLRFTNEHPFINGDTVTGTVVQGANSVTGTFVVVDAATDRLRCTLANIDGTNVASLFGIAAATGTFRASPVGTSANNYYVVTAVAADGTESLSSSSTGAANNLFVEGAYNTVTWNAVAGAVQYRVYRWESGLYGFLGSTDASTFSFVDRDNLGVDLSITPKLYDSETAALYPAAVCYHEQRRVFALNQRLWATRSNTEADLTFTLPVKDDDRLLFQIAATEYSAVQHLVSLGELLALTTSSEFVISSPDSVALTPTSLMSRPHSFVGASSVRPSVVNNSVIFEAARGGHLRELSFRAEAQGFTAVDLSMRAAHLFDGHTIADLSVMRAPYQVVWAVSSTGDLLGLTYVPEQQVAGWHVHPTHGGLVESCLAIAEGVEDALYVLVRRTIDGTERLCIERMASMLETDLASMVFVDAAVRHLAATAGQLGGHDHLAGATVSILADGVVLPQQVVNAAGEITLAKGYAEVVVGLPIDAELQTLPLAYQIDGFGQGQEKNVNRVWLRVAASSTFQLGASSSSLVPSASADPAPRGLPSASALTTGRFPVTVPGQWSADGQVLVRQPWPLPLTVLGITIDATIGG